MWPTDCRIFSKHHIMAKHQLAFWKPWNVVLQMSYMHHSHQRKLAAIIRVFWRNNNIVLLRLHYKWNYRTAQRLSTNSKVLTAQQWTSYVHSREQTSNLIKVTRFLCQENFRRPLEATRSHQHNNSTLKIEMTLCHQRMIVIYWIWLMACPRQYWRFVYTEL